MIITEEIFEIRRCMDVLRGLQSVCSRWLNRVSECL